ncbi:MAG: ATP-dependent zinc metalloprotease FtsH [Clostridia bacterium]|nr:ATP-dependent zinc metalloprotease FtsH [Clostridia bacterium]
MEDDNRNSNDNINGGGSGKRGNDNSDSKIFFKILIISLGLTFMFNLIMTSMALRTQSELNYSEFVNWVEQDKVEKVEFRSDKLVVYPYADKLEESDKKLVEGTDKFYVGRVSYDELVPILRKHNVEFYSPIQYNSPIISFFTSWILPLLIMYLGFTFIMRFAMGKMGAGAMGKSNAKVYMEKETGVTFADVAGQDEAKESLNEIIDFLHNPEKYRKIGAKQPKGALLVGPPGTGKTLLARAVAGEANVTFMSLSGSDFEEMFVGVGASRVRELFKSAQENAPCIVFIDELDAVGQKRDNRFGSNDQTLNQLLSEMDGFDSSKGVVILGATNRPEVLDRALLRPGRFDRRIIVENPDLKGRIAVLQVHFKGVKQGPDIDLEKIALATSGASGADLANIVNEAALRAVRLGRNIVLQEDLMESVEVVIAGKEKKDRIMSDKEKKIVAFHEVGHALAAALQKNAQPVQKITIIPRTMGSLGYTMQMPEEERYLMSKDEIIAKIVVYLAGRSAEEIEFGSITTGASNDIEMATNLARNMISLYGMSDKFDMMALESVQNKYLSGDKVAVVGERTIAELDAEVLSIIKDCHEKAKTMLIENKAALEEIAMFLYERENISGEEFMEIFRKYNSEEKKDEAIEGNN